MPLMVKLCCFGDQESVSEYVFALALAPSRPKLPTLLNPTVIDATVVSAEHVTNAIPIKESGFRIGFSHDFPPNYVFGLN
jgi:hypothetical protein